MRRHVRACLGASFLLLSALAAAGLPGRAAADAPDTVRIGLAQSLFRDVPAPVVAMLGAPFRSLMRAQTGLDGKLLTVPTYADLGRQLHEDKVHLGVFHGVEFAWAQEQYKDLRPLCIAVNRERDLYAYLVTRQDGPVHTFSDLKGKAVALPLRSREHCRLFLEHECARAGQAPAEFLGQVTRQANVEAALDDVLRGKVQAAVVDGVSLDCYRQVKPGCHARLRVLAKSDRFPAAVIAYHQGALDPATLNRFKAGMVSANQTERGRDLMNLWKLTAFEAVPADYGRELADILKSYPAPPAGRTAAAGRPAITSAP
jgi:ABC-type phosphate/phosphonate transport system substrate-binding protein